MTLGGALCLACTIVPDQLTEADIMSVLEAI